MIQVQTSGSQVLKVTVYHRCFPFIMVLQGISSTIFLKGLRNVSTISHHLTIICQNLLCQGQVCLAKCNHSMFPTPGSCLLCYIP